MLVSLTCPLKIHSWV